MKLLRDALLLAGLLFPGRRRKKKKSVSTAELDVSQLTWNECSDTVEAESRPTRDNKDGSLSNPSISPSGHLNLPPTGLDLHPSPTWEERLEQSKNNPFAIDRLRHSLFRDQPPAESLSPTSSTTDSQWLRSISNTGEWHRRPQRKLKDPEMQRAYTRDLFYNMFELFSNYTRQFNSMVGFDNLKIHLTEPSHVSEKRLVRKTLALSTVEKTEEITYERWRVSSRSWAISGRAVTGVIELYLIPCSDVMLLSVGEQAFRRRLKVELRPGGGDSVWNIDGLPAGTDDIRVATRQMFKELVRNTQENEQPLQEMSADEHTVTDCTLQNSISKLLAERQNLAQKVVIQQEDIQRRIARDLHDAVISDVMSLKRDLSSENKPSADEIISGLETVIQHLREICYELSPRDLGDWGLQVVLEDLLESIGERTGADCVLNCDVDIPPLPGAVELHVYRIAQECLNNVAKYAEATRVVVTIDLRGNTLSLLIADNGKGFNAEKLPKRDPKTGGYGMTSIRERVELIRCFFPARIQIHSTPNKGTQTRLEIDLID